MDLLAEAWPHFLRITTLVIDTATLQLQTDTTAAVKAAKVNIEEIVHLTLTLTLTLTPKVNIEEIVQMLDTTQ